jgi:type I restriction enzyme S subunit
VSSFEIPQSWIWTSLAELAAFSAGRTPPRNDLTFWNTGDHRWVSIADMTDGSILMSTKETVSEKAAAQVFGSPPLPPGTMLMSFKLTIGKVARLGVPAYHNEAIINIRPYLPATDPYLFLALPARARAGAIKGAIKGATLNRQSLSNITVPLPPIDEQHRIVAKVEELMALCDELEAAQTAREARRDRLRMTSLTTLVAPDGPAPKESARFFLKNSPRMVTKPEHVAGVRQTILDLAVRGRLVAQNAGDEPVNPAPIRATARVQPIATNELPFTAPRSWEWRRLGSAAELINGDRSKNYPNKHEYAAQGVAWINTGHIDPDGTLSKTRMHYITRAKFESLRGGKVKPDDLVYCLRGTIGKTAIVDWLDEGAVASSLVIVRLDQTIAIPSFIRNYLVSPTGQQLIQRFDNGSAQPNLAANSVKQFVTPVPPLGEQRRIVAKVDELMAVCDELERSLARAQTGRTRLLGAVLAQAIAHGGPEPERV